MKIMRNTQTNLSFMVFAILCLLLFQTLYAGTIPMQVNYQGYVTKESSAYNGTGYFKFVMTNSAGTLSIWSNDGTSTGGNAPTSAVQITVSSGSFNVVLGDTSIDNMNAIPATVFTDNSSVYLKTFFSETASDTFQELTPKRQIVASPYAFNAYEAYTLAGQTAPSSDIVGVSDDQTITNKELTAPVITSSSDAPSSTTEGTMYYDTDDDNLYVYANGSWVDLTSEGNSGDITGVTAGTGLSGGGDSGAVTLNVTSGLDDIVGLTSADGNFIVGSGDAWVAESGSTARNSLGLGNMAEQDRGSVDIGGGTISGVSMDSITSIEVGNLRLQDNTLDATDNNGLSLFDNSSNGIFIEDGGNVGLGTSTPSAELDIKGNLSVQLVGTVSISAENNVVTGSEESDFWGTVAISPLDAIKITDGENTQIFTVSTVPGQQELHVQGTSSYNFSGANAYVDPATLLIAQDGNGVTKFLVKKDGKVGIMSDETAIGSLTSRLHVYETEEQEASELLSLDRWSNSPNNPEGEIDYTILRFRSRNGDSQMFNFAEIRMYTMDVATDTEDGDFAFWLADGDNNGDLAERMRIDSDGVLTLNCSGTATGVIYPLTITNDANATSMTDTRSSILFQQYYYDESDPQPVDAGKIIFGTEGNWTSTASTQDSYLGLETVVDGVATERLRINSSGNVVIGTTGAPSSNADLTLEGGALCLKETTTPTADTDYGKVYTKNDNKLYFQDGAGSESELTTGGKAYGMAYRSTSFNIDTTNTWTNLGLNGGNANLVNVTHVHDGDYPERVAVDIAGIYLIQYRVYFRRSDNPHHGVTRLIKNGSTEVLGSYGENSNTDADGNEVHPASGHTIVSLEADDYVTIQIGQNANIDTIVNLHDDGSLPDPDDFIYASLTIVKIGP